MVLFQSEMKMTACGKNVIGLNPVNLKFVSVWTKARLKFTITLAVQIKIRDSENEWCRRKDQTNQQNKLSGYFESIHLYANS